MQNSGNKNYEINDDELCSETPRHTSLYNSSNEKRWDENLKLTLTFWQ